jgi:uncharacterized protein
MADIKVEFDVPAAMRDGAVLRANVFRPADDQRYPVALMRTPYGKNFSTTSMLDAVRLARAGYIIVIQDVRGRFDSDGEFTYMGAGEREDGYDTVEWASQLRGCTGKVGMWGSSYFGFTQWAAASLQPPHLKAIIPGVIGDDPFNGLVGRGGAIELGTQAAWLLNTIAPDILTRRYKGKSSAELLPVMETYVHEVDNLATQGYWSLPLNQFAPCEKLGMQLDRAGLFSHWMDRSYVAGQTIKEFYGNVTVPAYMIGGWYDIFNQGSLNNFNALRREGRSAEARQSKLLYGPWMHTPWSSNVGDVDFGIRSSGGFIDLQFDLTALAQRWFDFWLKGIDNGILREPPIKMFIMGANQWRFEQEWPLARTTYVPFYLHSAGHANSCHGDGALNATAPVAEAEDHYAYDPAHPVMTWGGALLMHPSFGPGVRDQRRTEERQDVLVYTSAPLEQDMEITGPVSVKLWAASDAPDTDFVARLVDVHPDGFAQNITDGIIRARYRNGDQPELLESGKVNEYAIDLWSTANVFKRGHCIRIDVTSSNFPRWDRNPNTGHDIGVDTEIRLATQTILHDAEHPSHVVLPVIPS